MPGIGTIRVDLVANTVEFLRSIEGAQKKLERFGDLAARAIKDMDRAFTKLGTELSAKVTAPLVALSFAAYKAADPAKKLTNEYEKMGLRVQAALRPIGNVLADALDKARPSIYRAIGLVNALTEAFEKMDPKAQSAALAVGGVAAAIGPALLMMSALTASLKFSGQAISTVYSALKSVLALAPATLVFLGSVAVGAATVAAAFDLGERIYNSSKEVQTAMAGLTTFVLQQAERIRAGFEMVFENISLTWRKLITEIIGDKMLSQAASAAFAAMGNLSAANTFSALGGMDVTKGETYTQLNDRLSAKHNDRMAAINDELKAQLDSINRDFAARASGEPGPNTTLETMLAQLSTLGDRMAPITGAFDKIWQRSKDIAEVEPPILSAKDLKLAEDHLAKVLQYEEKIFDEARATRAEVLPAEVFGDQMARLRDLQRAYPSIVNDQVFADKAQKIRDQLVSLEAANGKLWARMELSVRGFSEDAGQWFADLVLKGKASFKEILNSWTSTLLAMVSKTLVFEPLARSIGAGVGSLLGGPSTTAGYTSQGVPYGAGIRESKMGNIFSSGLLQRFAAGGMFGGPTYFQTADGKGNVAGEAGAEGILPLERIGGKLGVNATGAIEVNVYNSTKSSVDVQQSRGPDGKRILEVIITEAVNDGIARGKFDRAMNSTFGLSRQGTRR